MKQISQFRWRPKSKALGDGVDALDVVYAALSPSIRFSLEECVDIPPTTFIHRHVPLTPSQQKAYNEMRTALVTETDDGRVSAANEGVKASKLVQIATGCVRLPDGRPALLDAEPRMAETLTLVRASASKAIVFVPFVFAIHTVAEYLRKAGLTVEVVYGAVTKAERDRIFGLFQNAPDPHVLVCQPEVMAHSLTLTAASTSIWYAPYTKASIFEQANCRTPRPGQKLKTLVAMIGGTPIEKLIYQRLAAKQSMQGILLEMVRGRRE
jgi:SNF2 family DNA or RNA helicase